ncbi:MAG: DUF4178 domain-containing protein [Deltaproteobacteria bacterium]|nr:DUF4178 domain-containing protein [Deltaproteobacteria bacterium]
MSARVANCPSCGAQVTFRAGSSLLSVCAFCSSVVARLGGDVTELEILGKVAPLAELGSPISLGLSGKYQGCGFTVLGHLQPDWGAGPWNEWYVLFDDGRWGWLAEAQGKVYLTFEEEAQELPRYPECRVGARYTFAGKPVVVVERRRAKYLAAEGELPSAIGPGVAYRYADLQGPGGVFGTIDFGEDDSASSLYLGAELEYAELFDRSVLAADRAKPAAMATSLHCPQCGAAVPLRAPGEAMRVTCPSCDSLLDASRGSELFLLNAATKKGPAPRIPLGSVGTHLGEKWTVFAMLERAVSVEGVTYAWEEYLLRSERLGWRWLVCAENHWSWVDPVNTGDLKPRGKRVSYRDETFKHFQSSTPRVTRILGELYWKVTLGEQVSAADYVAPPRMLSKEANAEEEIWSLGTYLTPEQVQQIFGLKARLPKPRGVAPHQPNPYREAGRRIGGLAVVFTAILFALAVLIGARSAGRVVYEGTIPLTATLTGAPSEAGQRAVLSEPFSLEARGNLEVEARADVDNSWAFVAGALINDESGEVRQFGIEVSYYHGSSGGESWSEGSPRDSVVLGSVTPGQYLLRFDPQWDTDAPRGPYHGRTPTMLQVRARSQVFLFSHLVLVFIILWIYPALLVVRRAAFEGRRWQESDYAG